MFVQLKTGYSTDQGPCWISRVRFSKSWQTAYFHGLGPPAQGIEGSFVDTATEVTRAPDRRRSGSSPYSSTTGSETPVWPAGTMRSRCSRGNVPDRAERVDRESIFEARSATCGTAQLAPPVLPGGPSSTVGTYSSNWSPPSKVRL
jgi:hypothetical protein